MFGLPTSRYGADQIMVANNELAPIQPVKEIAALSARNELAGIANLATHRCCFRPPEDFIINVDELGCDLLSLSAHKTLTRQRSVGALYVRRGVLPESDCCGHQERDRRSRHGKRTRIVAFGAAAQGCT